VGKATILNGQATATTTVFSNGQHFEQVGAKREYRRNPSLARYVYFFVFLFRLSVDRLVKLGFFVFLIARA
jgi:hypothetical protein